MKPELSKSFPTAFSASPFDMKDFMESGRKSVQAFADAQQLAIESAQTIMQRQTEIISQLVQDQTQITRQILAEGTPEEKIARGANLAREAYEKTVCGVMEVGDIASKSAREACDILNGSVAACLEEIKSSAEDSIEQKSKKSGKKAA